MVVSGLDFNSLQREAEARQLGAELYRQAAATSPQTVEALSAVLTTLADRTGGRLIRELAVSYAREMMAASAQDHYQNLAAKHTGADPETRNAEAPIQELKPDNRSLRVLIPELIGGSNRRASDISQAHRRPRAAVFGK